MSNLSPPPRDPRWAPLVALANSQHGLVTYAQLRVLGWSKSAISRHPLLHRVFPNVYAVGHTALSREARWLAAVLAGGEDAVLTRTSLAAHYALQKWAPSEPEVLIPRWHRPVPGIAFHTTRRLDSLDVTTHKGIPVTTVPRLFVDLTDELIAEELTALIHEAAYRNLLNLDAVRRTMARANGRHNLHVLEQAIEDWLNGSAGIRSRGEGAFRRAITALGLPAPRTNMKVLGIEVDFHWPDRKLVIEIDGPPHQRPPSRVADANRDVRLETAGFTVLRCKTEVDAVRSLRDELGRKTPE